MSSHREPRLPTRRQTHGVPRTVPLPKFLKPEEVKKISARKAQSPARSWESLIRDAVVDGVDRRLTLDPS